MTAKPKRQLTALVMAVVLVASIVGVGTVAVAQNQTNETEAADGVGLNETATEDGVATNETATENETETEEAAGLNETANETEEVDTQDISYLRVVHASPDAQPVDVAVDGETVVENISLGNASGYVPVLAGEHDVTITVSDAAGPVGENVTDTETETEEDAALNETDTETTNETGVGAGLNETTNETGADAGLNETTNETEPAEDGVGMNDTGNDTLAALQVNETANETGADVQMNETANETEDDTALGETANETEAANETQADGEVVFEGSVNVRPRSVTTIAATGEVTEGAETSFSPLLLQENAWEPAEDNAALSVVHASPNAPAVDIVTAENGTVIAEDVSFRSATNYVTVPAGDHTIEVRAASPDNDGEVLTTMNVSVEGGNAYSAYAIGYANDTAADATGADDEAAMNETTNETGADAGLNETGDTGLNETEADAGLNETTNETEPAEDGVGMNDTGNDTLAALQVNETANETGADVQMNETANETDADAGLNETANETEADGAATADNETADEPLRIALVEDATKSVNLPGQDVETSNVTVGEGTVNETADGAGLNETGTETEAGVTGTETEAGVDETETETEADDAGTEPEFQTPSPTPTLIQN